eukprot:m.442380 g.442380  ORF g.442380 m.442380 type:complete len:57 (-) comp131106_c1_seq1:103-273(-)
MDASKDQCSGASAVPPSLGVPPGGLGGGLVILTFVDSLDSTQNVTPGDCQTVRNQE